MSQNSLPIDMLWLDANIATFANADPYGAIEQAALATCDNKIIWLGKQSDLPIEFRANAKNTHSLANKWITPGLIDCHTHLVYAGNRANEFEMRLQGKSYADIAKIGGGILSTVKATRAATEEELFLQSAKRLKKMLADGVTTVEIKSGYGLDLDTEIKCLRIARKLQQQFPVTIKTTYLGAHTLPPEFSNADQYIDYMCEIVMPKIKQENLVDYVDGFCEQIAFNLQQITQVFNRAKELGLPVKLHAEQLSNSKGTKLAASFSALSADHLEYADEEAIIAMAKANTVAVLLPGAFYFLREKQFPPLALLRHYQVPIAIATDCNPGTSPITSLLLILNMACVLFQLTPEEALAGVTKHAAKALGMEATHGTLSPGKIADFVVWDVSHPSELAYQIGMNSCIFRVKNGEII